MTGFNKQAGVFSRKKKGKLVAAPFHFYLCQRWISMNFTEAAGQQKNPQALRAHGFMFYLGLS